MKPIIYCITNYVSANFVANALLAIGASPIMSSAIEEVEDLCAIADALVINIGTPSKEQFATMLAAGKRMHELGKPIVLDPVGVNATHYRLQMAQELIATVHPTVIKGNASEILALATNEILGTGLDANIPYPSTPLPLYSQADDLAKSLGAIIVISGPTDYITDGTHTASVTLGSPQMALTTGTGCVASAIIAASLAIHNSRNGAQSTNPLPQPKGRYSSTPLPPFHATIKAMTLMGQAGTDMPHFLERLCDFAL